MSAQSSIISEHNEGLPKIDSQRLDLEQMQDAFAHFNRLSESFVHSYQSLEGQVENLADRLASEVRNKQLQLQEKERLAQKLSSLLSILPAGVVVLDEQGCVQDCNAVAVDLLGRPLLGEKWMNIIQRAFSPRSDDGHEISLKDGRRVRIETRALDYEPGQLVVITDLTETRKLQDKLNQDKRLSSIGKMMASLAHQIRTPLSSALLYGANLSREDLTNTTRQKFGQRLLGCLHHLEQHVSDMLQFARSGGLQKSWCDVEKFVESIIQHVKQMNVDVDVELDVTSHYRIFVNEESVKSAVMNLIDNACQATEVLAEKAKVVVRFSVANDWLTIQVEDNGIGISESVKAQIFEPFFTTKSGGTGLGLPVLQGVVIAHDGKVDVDSEANKGTRFTVTLPCIQALSAE
ncbi:PAS domain-containing sensor histidine kinase [Pleionea sp. CnH1-48]|uniref:sensor histidine kinase n=1 Tax=Pleionea sp. CnH1-48 TaxID=2954494 RepID=UPI002097D29D|nr:PAS domain-containing sensor histidine kinase [Pleionea sp. CnH1-48]MCO7226129.1 PAS domain-containing sensor histidine kinase [Pleionea sp. CnH1-48]